MEIISQTNGCDTIDWLQGLLKHEGKAKFGAAFRQWQMDAANFNIDDHYPVRELWARARCCWTKILTHESKSVLVVAHNAVNQALVATAIGTVSHLIVNLVLYYVNCHFQCSFFFPFLSGNQVQEQSISGFYSRAIAVQVCWISLHKLMVGLHIFVLIV